jgi:peroxiredoxin
VRWPLEAAAFLLVFLIVQQWQSRNLLPAEGSNLAPGLQGPLLDGGSLNVASFAGRPTLVYFFAPWCKVCAFSASSLQGLRDSYGEQELAIVLVALSFDDVEAVRRFRDEHQLTIPILLGNESIASRWHIYGFPTYYLLDRESHIVSRDFGVSTSAGLRLRVMKAL